MTIVRRPSASQLGKALRCPRSCWAPAPELAPESPTGEAALKGNRLHAAIERAFLGAERGDVLACVLPHEEAEVEAILADMPKYDSALFPEWPIAEVECWQEPLSREARRGLRAPCHHENPYPPPAGWFRGTADFIGLVDGVPTVRDWKTGNPANQSPPSVSAQLYFFAGFLATHPRTAPLVAERGVRLELYLTQLAGSPKAHPSFIATPAQIETFMGQFQDLALAVSQIEAGGEMPDDPGPCGDRFCAVAAHRPQTRSPRSRK